MMLNISNVLNQPLPTIKNQKNSNPHPTIIILEIVQTLSPYYYKLPPPIIGDQHKCILYKYVSFDN